MYCLHLQVLKFQEIRSIVYTNVKLTSLFAAVIKLKDVLDLVFPVLSLKMQSDCRLRLKKLLRITN